MTTAATAPIAPPTPRPEGYLAAPAPGDEERWQAVLAGDASFDGVFVYAVRSTGVYCRPSCPARRPGRERVRFFDVPAAAERVGFRPCRRCRPDRAAGLAVEAGEQAGPGETRGARRASARPATVRYAIADCALGRLLVAATERGVCAVAMADADGALEAFARAEHPSAALRRDDAGLADWVQPLLAHLAGQRAAPATPEVPLDVPGSAFQQVVWAALRQIPPGATRTYEELARSLGRPTATRAVARACATNPASIVVPCHRVVRKDGGLGGYRWGLERKRALLDLERRQGGAQER